MAILFLSTRQILHNQSKNLLVSLKSKDFPFCFACPENSLNAGFASACALAFSELPENGFMRFLAVKKYVRQNGVTHIHVFDENALKLARRVKLFVPGLQIVGDWHDRLMNGAEMNIKKYPYLQAFAKGRFDVFFCSSPELFQYLGRTCGGQERLGLLPFVPEFSAASSRLEKDPQVFGFFLHSYCENDRDLPLVLQAVQKVLQEPCGRKLCFFLCAEKTECVAQILGLAQEYGIEDRIVCADKSFFSVFYPLCDSVLCASSDGEGDYSMIYRAWHDGKMLIASDLGVHTKFVLSDSMDCALLYPRDDAASLAKCMQKILSDGVLCRQLAAGGKEKAGQNLAEILAEEYLKKLNLS